MRFSGVGGGGGGKGQINLYDAGDNQLDSVTFSITMSTSSFVQSTTSLNHVVSNASYATWRFYDGAGSGVTGYMYMDDISFN
jgi:hypothetical protein